MNDIPKPPAHLAPYVEVLGAELAVEFLLRFGGAELYIARKPGDRSPIAKAFGMDAARALGKVNFERGLPARVPTGKKWIAQVMRSQGHSVPEIARTIHMSDTAVRGYLRHTPQNDPRQLPLL